MFTLIVLLLIGGAGLCLYKTSDVFFTLVRQVMGDTIVHVDLSTGIGGDPLRFSSPVFQDHKGMFIYRCPATRIRRLEIRAGGDVYDGIGSRGKWAVAPFEGTGTKIINDKKKVEDLLSDKTTAK